MIARFFQHFADHRLLQRFPLLQVPGGLIPLQAFIRVLFNQQELAFLLNDGRNGDVRFPDHDMLNNVTPFILTDLAERTPFRA